LAKTERAGHLCGHLLLDPGPALLRAALLLLLLSGCSMDKGFTGLPPPGDLLLATQGCARANPFNPTVLSVGVPLDVTQVDVTLEVVRTQIDMVFGAGKYPRNYFSFNPHPGLQRVRVGPSSNAPLTPGTWEVRLHSLAGPSGVCEQDDEASADWRLWVSRAREPQGVRLLDESCDSPDCAVPGCVTPGNCPPRIYTLDVPEDAVSLEISLESPQGDADLWVRTASGEELLGSMNPGPGFDIVHAEGEACAALRGQTLTLVLESWAEATTEYRLSAVYLSGQI